MSLSHIVLTTLPLVAQHLQVASNHLSWRQVERLQLIYNYSCQAGDYYWSYYKSTLELYHNMTTTPKKDGVIDVEKEDATTASTSLPPLRAPRTEFLGDWHDVKDYLIDNLVRAHMHYEYKSPSKTMAAYYSTFSELLLPVSTDGEGDDSESEEELQAIIQTYNMWAPYHDATTEDPNPVKTTL